MLEVNTFTSGSSTNHYSRTFRLLKPLFYSCFTAVITAFEDDDTLAWIGLIYFLSQHLHGTKVSCKNNDSLLGILIPQDSESRDQFFYLGFLNLRELFQ